MDQSFFAPVTVREDLKSLSLPVIAVDLGFSANGKSCGIARRDLESATFSENHRFATTINKVHEFSRERGAILILEAPLSVKFDKDGNPSPRGDFERNPKPRWWSFGAGAVMTLAAQFFLRDLRERRRREGVTATIHLIEGFVVGSNSGDHKQVAEDLINAYRDEITSDWIKPDAGSQSVLGWFDENLATSCPVVLKPRFDQ